jgi:hypothetical protein
VFRITSLIGTWYMPGKHSLPTVPHMGLSGSSPVSVTGRTERCMSLSSPQTSSDMRVRAGPSIPVEGSAMTTKQGSRVKYFVSGLKKTGEYQESSKSVPRGEFIRFIFSLQIMGCAVEIQIVDEGLPSCAFNGDLHWSQVSCFLLIVAPRLTHDACSPGTFSAVFS